MLVKFLFWLGGISLFFSAPPAFGSDVFSTEKLAPQAQAKGEKLRLSPSPCSDSLPENVPLTLSDVVDRALCSNPQTKIAWINAKAQAAIVGVSKSAYFPSLSITGSEQSLSAPLTAGAATNSSYNQSQIAASLNYTLYDFGQRSANLENTLETLHSLNATQDATLQNVFFSAVQGYYQLLAAQALIASSKDAEKSALEAYSAADEKFKIGSATPSDRLQAKTAHSQAVLTRIQAEGTAMNALGTLANILGIEPTRKFSVAPPNVLKPDMKMETDVGRLIDLARAQRPDLIAAQAQIKAAQANVEAVKSSGLANISLSGSYSSANNNLSSTPTNSSSVGLQLTIPLFTGFSNTYNIRASQEQAALKSEQERQLSLQVSLDVWQGYQNLLTATQAVASSDDLVLSANEAEKVMLARYKGGLGSILDLLTTQSTLASARQQQIQALYTWHISKATLAKSIGQLDYMAIAGDAPKIPHLKK
jgi:outer membrane protein